MKNKELINKVLSVTSELTGISKEDVKFKKHNIKCVDARRIFSFVCIKGGLSTPSEIARFLETKHNKILFYRDTIYLANFNILKKVFLTCQNFIDFDLRELNSLKPSPVKHYEEFKHWDLIFKNNENER